jgi:hypothetical protein
MHGKAIICPLCRQPEPVPKLMIAAAIIIVVADIIAVNITIVALHSSSTLVVVFPDYARRTPM